MEAVEAAEAVEALRLLLPPRGGRWPALLLLTVAPAPPPPTPPRPTASPTVTLKPLLSPKDALGLLRVALAREKSRALASGAQSPPRSAAPSAYLFSMALLGSSTVVSRLEGTRELWGMPLLLPSTPV